MYDDGRSFNYGIVLCYSLPLSLLLDAVIYKIFGNTPGKALLRVTGESV